VLHGDKAIGSTGQSGVRGGSIRGKMQGEGGSICSQLRFRVNTGKTFI
jgi:hypothetical protein